MRTAIVEDSIGDSTTAWNRACSSSSRTATRRTLRLRDRPAEACLRQALRQKSIAWRLVQQWLPGAGQTISDARASPNLHISNGRYRRVATLGSFIGGYAALLFVSPLEVDKVWAFDPQTSLKRLLPLSPPWNVEIEFADLAEGKGMSRAAVTRFDTVIGDNDAVDLCRAVNVPGLPRVRIWTVLGFSRLVREIEPPRRTRNPAYR